MSIPFSIINCPLSIEVIAKPQKRGAKPVGQDLHVGRKISYIAAQAASTIVHYPLSIVNFLGFATASCACLAPQNQSWLFVQL
jgi:hypothetical protein